jgi:uncharacterized protein
MQQRLSLITLGVGDVTRAQVFYEGLGWKVTAAAGVGDDKVVFFQAGCIVVALWDRTKLAEDTGVADGGGWGGVTLAYNTSSSVEVDEVMTTAEAAGASIVRPAGRTFWGGYSGVFIDPDGHPWEIAHNPDWVITETGATTIPV